MGKLADAAVAGVYQTKQGDLSEQTQPATWWESVRGACADAGLDLGDIDGLIGAGPNGVGLRDGMPAAGVAELLGHPIRFYANSNVGAASTAAGLNLAAYAVSHGLAEVVVIGNAVAGRGEGYASASRDAAVAAMAKLSGPYEYVYGTTRISDYATLAMRHFHEYGTTLGAAGRGRGGAAARLHPAPAVGARAPGRHHVEDVTSSRMIADPLHLLDCCSVNQGGGAIMVTTADRVRGDRAARPGGPAGLRGGAQPHRPERGWRA